MSMGGGRSCISVGENDGRSAVGTSVLKLGPSGWRRPWSGKELGEVEVSEW